MLSFCVIWSYLRLPAYLQPFFRSPCHADPNMFLNCSALSSFTPPNKTLLSQVNVTSPEIILFSIWLPCPAFRNLSLSVALQSLSLPAGWGTAHHLMNSPLDLHKCLVEFCSLTLANVLWQTGDLQPGPRPVRIRQWWASAWATVMIRPQNKHKDSLQPIVNNILILGNKTI